MATSTWPSQSSPPHKPVTGRAAARQRSHTQKLRASCDGCHLAKVKCSKGQPACNRCLSMGTDCLYSPSLRAGKPKGSKNNMSKKMTARASLQVQVRDGAKVQKQEQTPIRSTGQSMPFVPTPTPSCIPQADWVSERKPIPEPQKPLPSKVFKESHHFVDPFFFDGGDYHETQSYEPGAELVDLGHDPFGGTTFAPALPICAVPSMEWNGSPQIEPSHALLTSSDYSLSSTPPDRPSSLSTVSSYTALHSCQGSGPLVSDELQRRSQFPNYGPSPPTSRRLYPSSCNCFSGIVSTLHGLQLQIEAADAPFDVTLAKNKEAIAMCDSILRCQCHPDSSTILLLVALIGKILLLYQSLEQIVHLPTRLTLGSYEMDSMEDEGLKIIILLIELRKLNGVLSNFAGRFCNSCTVDQESASYEALVSDLGRRLSVTVQAWQGQVRE